MTDLVSQPTAMPTRKLTSAVIATILMELAKVIVSNLWPSWYDANLWLALTPLVVLLVGYVVKDAPNVVADFKGENAP